MKKYFSFIVLSIICIAIDQLIKWWVQQTHPLFIVANSGVLFGWINKPWVNFLLLFIGFIVLIWLIIKSDLTERWQRISLVLIASGAISNLLDRLIYGYVIDYINPGFWPTFNLADVFIFVGILIYASQIFRHK